MSTERKAFRIGIVCLWLGLFIDLVTANPWGTPAVQPWFLIGGMIAGVGIGSLLFAVHDL